MIRHKARKFFLESPMALVATAAVLLAGPFSACAQDQAPATSNAVLHVGTYDLKQAFQAHPAQAELMNVLGTAQTQMQQAQQEGDQQKMQQIQQEFERTQAQVIEKFERDVADALPAAAEAADVKVAALEVMYTAPEVQTQDITPQLIEAFNQEVGDARAEVGEDAEVSVQVGTYDSEVAFQAHPLQAELTSALGTAQAEMQQAQQDGDLQKIQQIQEQYEQTHGRVIEKFERDVAKAMPAVAEAADLKVAALQVTYAAAEVQTEDITSQLIEAFNEIDE